MTLTGMLGFGLCLLGSFLVGRKLAVGFLISLAGHICWTVIGIREGLPDLTWCSVAFAVLSIWNFGTWIWMALDQRTKALACPRNAS